jgi:hypothetical protein
MLVVAGLAAPPVKTSLRRYGQCSYNSLQVTLKHTSGGLTFLANYTYGRSLDQASNLGEQVYPYNYEISRAPSSFDIRHDFQASFRYSLPLQKLFHRSNRATQGWAISGIGRVSTGLPVTLINPNDTALIGSYNNGVYGVGYAGLNVAPGSLELNHSPGNG